MQTPGSPLQLPEPIASYFAHEASDPRAVARAFSDDALVYDEGHEHRGRAAIAAWNADVIGRYDFRSEPLTFETRGAETTVTARVSGNFPGSPVQLGLRFTVTGELISRLEIGASGSTAG